MINYVFKTALWGALFLFMAVLTVGSSTPAYASKTRDIIDNQIILTPNLKHTVTIETNEPLVLGWLPLLNNTCDSNCITMSQKGTSWSAATRNGTTSKFMPVNGEISLDFVNTSDEAVTLITFRDNYVCDSFACAYLEKRQLSYPDQYETQDFNHKRVVLQSIEDFRISSDRSYSFIKATTVYGTKVNLVLIWWLLEENGPGCAPWLMSNTKKHASTPDRAYQFSGSYTVHNGIAYMADISCSSIGMGPRLSKDL